MEEESLTESFNNSQTKFKTNQDRGNKRLDIWGKNTNQWYVTMLTARDMECF